MEQELEAVGTVAAAMRRIVLALTPFIEGGLRSRHGRDWFQAENMRRARHVPEIDELKRQKISNAVVWGFTDLVRTMATGENWNGAFRKKFETATKNRRALEEIRNALFELAEIRNDAFHAEEAEEPFSIEQRDRFFELVLRILRAVGSAEAQKLSLDIIRVVEKMVPAADVAGQQSNKATFVITGGPEISLPENADSIAELYTTDEIPESTRNAVLERLSDELARQGWHLDTMTKGPPGWGCTSPAFNHKLIVHRPFIQLRPSDKQWLAYEHRPENLRIYVIAQAKKKGGNFHNDKKVRIASDFAGNNVDYVEIQETDYLSSAMTDQLRWTRVRSKRVSAEGFPAEVLWDGEVEFIENDSAALRTRLKGLGEVAISNQLAASTFAFSNDGHLMIVAQNDKNRESVNLLAPSGSGSLDWSDVENSPSQDLLSLVRFGAERELREECSLEKDGDKYPRLNSKVMPTGFIRMLHRGGKPEFFCLGRIDAPSKEISDRKPERYVQRVLVATNVKQANLQVSQPSKEISRVCRDYLERAFVNQQGKRIPMSYPLEHGLKLLIEACEMDGSSQAIDQFIANGFA
jgi:hypothetical protein